MIIINEDNPAAVQIAVQKLKAGEIICFATETVYALACDATNDLAVGKLYQLKGRDAKKPIAVFAKDLAVAENFLQFSDVEKKLAQRLMPGAITLILQKRASSISKLLNNNSAELGLRIPDHKFSLNLLNAFDGIIAATSANITNEAAAINCAQVKNYFGEKIDLIIDGGTCLNKIASTVLKIDGKNAKILRPGAVLEQQIKKTIDEIINS